MNDIVETKPKTWVQTVKPSVDKYRLWSSFPDLTYTMRSEETRSIADILQTCAEQIDDYTQTIYRMRSQLKWIILEAFVTGYFFAHLLNYLTF